METTSKQAGAAELVHAELVKRAIAEVLRARKMSPYPLPMLNQGRLCLIRVSIFGRVTIFDHKTRKLLASGNYGAV